MQGEGETRAHPVSAPSERFSHYRALTPTGRSWTPIFSSCATVKLLGTVH